MVTLYSEADTAEFLVFPEVLELEEDTEDSPLLVTLVAVWLEVPVAVVPETEQLAKVLPVEEPVTEVLVWLPSVEVVLVAEAAPAELVLLVVVVPLLAEELPEVLVRVF